MTEKSNQVQELLQAEEMREALVSSSPLPIIVLAATGEILLWNAAAERAFGWSAAEVLGGPLPFIPSERQEEHRAMRAQDLTGQGFTGREIRRKRKDGTWLDLSVSTAALHDKTGAVSGILSIYVDITSRKQAETELKRQAHELARSNADLQQFAHAVSHDLQEPLRAISSYAQLLSRRCGELDPTANEFLEFIVHGAQRMSALIKGLLAYSRVMEGENVRRAQREPGGFVPLNPGDRRYRNSFRTSSCCRGPSSSTNSARFQSSLERHQVPEAGHPASHCDRSGTGGRGVDLLRKG